MSKKPTDLWPAEPHTLAKLVVLRNYLESLFAIFGSTRKGQDILYIDGFAGPGIYKNGEDGSPIEALRSAAKITSGPFWKGGKINCIFIEKEKKFFNTLVERVTPFHAVRTLSIETINSTFIEGYERIKTSHQIFFKSQLPLFAFIDPFGISGAPFTIVREILSSPTSEVLINFDSDGLARNYRAYLQADDLDAKQKSEQLINSVFDSSDWKTIPPDNYQTIIPRMVDLYKEKLLSLPNVKYVVSFEMRGRLDQNNYYLVFASQHSLGLRKMKNAMKRIDQTGYYCFSDAGVGQDVLFRFDDPTEWALKLHKTFTGLRKSWDLIDDFTLLATPFENPKSMLKILENKGLIKVYSRNPNRMKGTFPDGTVETVEFLD